MTSGWGVDATVDGSGNVTSGTTSADVRKVWGALYTPGIISGLTVTRSASAMTFTVATGVAAVPSATGEIFMVPVANTTVTTQPAPSTGTRQDVIVVEQRTPTNGDSNAVVRVISFPSNTEVILSSNQLEIDRYQVSAGQISTNAAVRLGDPKYSIPYGGTLGTLHLWQHKFDGDLPNAFTRNGHGSFTLPTDRRVRFSYTVVLSARGASGFDNSKYCEYGVIFNAARLGGSGDFVLHSTPGLHQAWATYQFESVTTLPAGVNTVNIAMQRMVGPGTAWQHYGPDTYGYGRRGGEFLVEDLGPAI